MAINHGQGITTSFMNVGGCDVICNCNDANIGVVAFFLLERLNNNFYYTLEKLIIPVRIYIFCPPFFCQLEENFVKCSHERKEGKFSDSQIFYFYFFFNLYFTSIQISYSQIVL